MDIEPFIIPEEYLIGEGQLVSTEWVEKINGKEEIVEIEMIANYDNTKNTPTKHYIGNKTNVNSMIPLLTIIFLAENSSMCKYKTSNGQIKISVKNSLITTFLRTRYYDELLEYSIHGGTNRMSVQFKTITNVNMDMDYIYNSKSIYLTRYMYTAGYYCPFYITGSTLGFFMWNIDNENLLTDFPVITYGNEFGKYNQVVESHKIKRIKAFNNHGFFVQLNILNLKQICSLNKYNSKLIDLFNSKGYYINIYHCVNAIINIVHL